MGSLRFPAIPEMSRNGNAGVSRDSRAPYKGAGNGKDSGSDRTDYRKD